MTAEPLTTNAALAVDVVALRVADEAMWVLLVRRGLAPHRGRWALPGGFVLPAEDLPDAAARELREETDLRQRPAHLEQLATFGAPRRDPRGRVVSVAYLAMVTNDPPLAAGTDATAARWHRIDELPRLAFDHHEILTTGLERARSKLEYTTLATSFLPPEFTMADLQRVYEAIWGRSLDTANFRRKVRSTKGFVVPVASRRTTGGPGRPAALFRAGRAARLHPPILR